MQKKLIENINFFTSNINKIGFKTDSDKSTFRTQIIPLVIGDEKLTMQFSKTLLSNGVFIQAIRYPTVKIGFARLRASITAMLRKEQISIAIEKIETIGKTLNII